MEYRSFDKLGIEASLLGYGCMRFPTTPDGNIDEAEAERLLDKAYKNGCTGCGKCEAACPQHLPIREQLKLVQEELGSSK